MDYVDVVDEVNTHLINQTENLIKKGINKSQIAVDPGLGFGKKMDDSKELFLNLNNLIKSYPVVVGYSRKKIYWSNKYDNQWNERSLFAFRSWFSQIAPR